MAPITGLAVLVDGETITGVIPDGEVSTEYTAVDLRGGYLMPGLINLHIHIPGSGKPAKKQADTKKLVKLITSNGLTRKIGMNMCASFAKTELMSGVTTIRSVGGIQDLTPDCGTRSTRVRSLAPGFWRATWRSLFLVGTWPAPWHMRLLHRREPPPLYER